MTSSSFPFVHLRVHSDHSLVDSCLSCDALVAAASADAAPALALTDLGNMFAAVKFYTQARAQGIKPILGSEIYLPNPEDKSRPFRLLLLIQNRQGYLTLCDWLSRAWCQHQLLGKPLCLTEWFTEGTEGLLALSGGVFGEIGHALLSGNTHGANTVAQRLARWFPGRFYLEIQRAGRDVDERHNRAVLQLAQRGPWPVVATHPVQFLQADDYQAHEARVCIAEGEILANTQRVRRFTEEQYFKTQAEMQALFADLPIALANTVEVAKRCNLEFELGKPRLPEFPTPSEVSVADYLRQQADIGLRQRLNNSIDSAYEKRLAFECDTIINMGFPGYFLIVADFIRWAKDNGVPVGPGRGSGAGSLVAYSLGITELDPLRYNLLFERFLNPERVSMPDFDIDFCQEGRDRVIDYVRHRYGHASVSQIATFGTMAAKAAVRDVGRVLDLPYGFVDGIAKLIPFQPGKTVTIRRRTNPKDDKTIYAREAEPLLEQRERDEEEVAALLDLAGRVEGLIRNVGMHAGGVLIAPGKLTDFCPLYSQDGGNTVVSQFDKDDVEAVGLVKFDFLGLTTLTILDGAVRFIRQRYPEHVDFDVARLHLDDVRVFELLKSANTVAVFQLESRGMQDMLIKAQPDRFEDIIALVALYRPGPMDLIPDFCERKHGRQRVSYPHPDAEEILQETYGIMVYQEQVMQMAQRIGGYTLGRADLLRRAMGKKKPEEMAEHRAIFSAGAEQRGISAAKANEIFDLMEKFAGYGFNKSHAAAYALLSYQTAYLKAHFPAEFFAANMSCALDDTEKIRTLWDDAKRRNNITLLPPDINQSDYRFVPVGEPGVSAKAIRYGLGGIKGTGEGAVMEILRARKNGPFSSFFDFVARVDRRVVNRRTLEALIRAGAFDAVSPNRGAVFASVDLALNWAEQCELNAQQTSLFGDDSDEQQAPSLVTHVTWSTPRQLAEEKLVFGFSLSGNVFDVYREEVRQLARTPLAQLKPSREAQRIAGVVTGLRTVMGRRGKMAIVQLDDGSAQHEVLVFGELFEQHRQHVIEDTVLIIHGTVRHDEFSGGLKVSAEQIQTLKDARKQYARFVRFVFEQPEANVEVLMRATQPDGIKLMIELRQPHFQGTLSLPENMTLDGDDELLGQLALEAQATYYEVVY